MYALGFDFSASVSESESKLRFAFSCCFLRTTGSGGGAGAGLICVEGLPLLPAEGFSLSVGPGRVWAKVSEGFAGCQVGRADAFRVETNPPKKEGRLQTPLASCVCVWPPKFSQLSMGANRVDGCASHLCSTLQDLLMTAFLAQPRTFIGENNLLERSLVQYSKSCAWNIGQAAAGERHRRYTEMKHDLGSGLWTQPRVRWGAPRVACTRAVTVHVHIMQSLCCSAVKQLKQVTDRAWQDAHNMEKPRLSSAVGATDNGSLLTSGVVTMNYAANCIWHRHRCCCITHHHEIVH